MSSLDANNADSQGIVYTLDSPNAGEATVSGYTGPDGASIVIPAQVSKDNTPYNVVKIGNNAMMHKNIVSVILPDSIQTIGQYGFYDCSLLTNIHITANVSSIGSNLCTAQNMESFSVDAANTSFITDDNGILYHINSLDEHTLSLVEVPAKFSGDENGEFTLGAFTKGGIIYTVTDCNYNSDGEIFRFSNIPHLIIGDSVTALVTSMFYNATPGIVNVTVGNGITDLNSQFNQYGNNLTALTISASVTSIHNYAFNNLTSLTISSSNNTFAILDGVVYKKVDAANANAVKSLANVTSINFPENISIGGVVIPVTAIATRAFQNRSSLTSVLLTSNIVTIGDYAFFDTSIVNLVIPNSVTSLGQKILYDVSSLTSITLGTGIIEIKSECFSYTGISTITIPSNVTFIGSALFIYCTSLTQVTFLNTMTTIPSQMFDSCSSLSAITIPDSVTSIGSDAFYGTALTAITIPDSVTSIGSNAFSGTALTAITIPDSVTSIGSNAFRYCSSLTTISIPNSLTTTNWFGGPNALTNISIASDHPTTVFSDGLLYKKIQNGDELELLACFGITNLIIPADVDGTPVTLIGDDANTKGKGLTSVTIGNNVKYIGRDALQNNAFVSVTIPNSVTFIGLGAFANMNSITTVTIGSGVTTIGGTAFYNSLLADASVYFLGENYTRMYDALYEDNSEHDFFTLGQFQNANTVNKVAYYVADKTGFVPPYSSGSPPPGFSDIQTFVPPGATSGPTYTEGMNLASGSLTVPAGGQIGTVSGGSVTLGSSSLVSELTSGTVSIASGTSVIASVSGTYSLQMTSTGKLTVPTLNGQSGASITFATANNSIAVEDGSFNGIISGAGTIKKTTANTLILSGNNSGFSGPTEITQGTVEITHPAALGSGSIKLGAGLPLSAPNLSNVALVIDCASAEIISNSVEATSSATNTVTNASTASLTFTGGFTKNGTTLILDGDFTVDCDIIGSSANSDLTISGDVTLVSGNTYDYNGPTTVTTGSLTLEDDVSLPNSDLTIDAGATLVLEYTTSTISANTVKSLTLENGSTMIVDISTNLVAGAYTVLTATEVGTVSLNPTNPNPATITVNYTGTNGFTATIAIDSSELNYVVTITDPNPTTPSSNVCFPAKTPVLTNCGYVNIEDINLALHTIRNKKIVAITKTVAHDKNLVRIAKHALGKNYPEKTTFISQNHKVFCQGQMIKAKHLVNETTVTLVPYKGEALYNVLLAEHEKMQVNNLIVETLHPEHKVAKLYRFLKNVDAAHHGKLIALFNKKDQEHRKSTF